jgi:hypothetical protein
MALLWFDGFEGSSNGFALRYNFSSGGAVNNTNPPAPGGGFVKTTGGGGFVRRLFATPVSSPATVVVGVRVLPALVGNLISTQNPKIIQFRDDINTIHGTVVINGVGASISVYRGDNATLLATSATNVTPPGVWTYVECKYTCDDTNGGFQVKANGVDIIKIGAFADTPTTLDTRNGGNANVNAIQWAGTASVFDNNFIDDVYVCDTTGSAPYDDFLGDVRVIEILPNAAGDSTQWTPNAGNNWDRVDDANNQDGDTTYVASSTAGHTDLYNMTAAASGATVIRAAKVIATARKADAGAQSLELLVKSGSTTDASSAFALTDGYTEYNNTYLQNPDTTADWTVADLDALQSGFRIPV